MGWEISPYVDRVKRLGFDILEVACHQFQTESDDTVRR